MSTSRRDEDDMWPSLPYADWQPTLDTIHMWTQVVVFEEDCLLFVDGLPPAAPDAISE